MNRYQTFLLLLIILEGLAPVINGLSSLDDNQISVLSSSEEDSDDGYDQDSSLWFEENEIPKFADDKPRNDLMKSPTYEIVPSKGDITTKVQPNTTAPTGSGFYLELQPTIEAPPPMSGFFYGFAGVFITFLYLALITTACVLLATLMVFCAGLAKRSRLPIPQNIIPIPRLNVPPPLFPVPQQPRRNPANFVRIDMASGVVAYQNLREEV